MSAPNHTGTPSKGQSVTREQHLRWLLEVTQIPTASGQEWRVIDWIRRWALERPALRLDEDPSGNLVVSRVPARAKAGLRAAKTRAAPPTPPIFITAHLDHPAFVVERILAPGTAELSFRGGVMDPYFENAGIVIHAGGRDGRPAQAFTGTLTGVASAAGSAGGVFTTYFAEFEAEEAEEAIRLGDVGVWALPAGEVRDEIVHTSACDDLAAVVAAVSAMDELLALAERGEPVEDVRLLFTRAEEIGFIGAIAACKHGTMPKGSRVIALENSRSFSDSPIGGGPIVRVGDRMSVFSPRLTAACAKRAEELSGRSAAPTASQTQADLKGWKWQRKLMAGGACETTVFCAYGYEATCLCLPLGNYHNMSDLQSVQDGTFDQARNGPPRVGREYIGVEDFHGLVDLLVGIGQSLPTTDPALPRIEMLYHTRGFVLGTPSPPPGGGRAATKSRAKAPKPAPTSAPARAKTPARKPGTRTNGKRTAKARR